MNTLPRCLKLIHGKTPLNFSRGQEGLASFLNWKYHNEGYFFFSSPLAAQASHTFLPPLPPCVSRAHREGRFYPYILLEIRDLNGGVSSEKMDSTQLMWFFFFFFHLVGIDSSSQLWLTRDGRVMNPKRKTLSMFIFFFFF